MTKMTISSRAALPHGAIIKFAGEVIFVNRDFGGESIAEVVLDDGVMTKYQWKFEGEECEVVATPAVGSTYRYQDKESIMVNSCRHAGKEVVLPNGSKATPDLNGMCSFVCAMTLSDVIQLSLEGFNDHVSWAATGSDLGTDISYSILSGLGDTLVLKVTMGVNEIIDADTDGDE